MPAICIQRTNEYLSRMRHYQLFLDDKPLGRIANGETKIFIVPAGAHSLKAKIDWCSGPELNFELNDADQKEFLVSGFKGATPFLLLMIGLAVLQMISLFIFETKGLSVLLLITLLMMVYKITFGRNNFLRLSEMRGLESAPDEKTAFAP